MGIPGPNLPLGSLFDNFLAETGDPETVTEMAIRRVLALEPGELMVAEGLTKAELVGGQK